MDKAAGETGIFGGGVGGTGELFGTLCSEGHAVDDGIVRLGYRFRFRGEVIEFLVVGDVRLVGRELENEVHSSLKSESTSVTSYRSSKLCICRCHSVSEQDDVVPADNGERRRFSFESERLERPAVMSFSCGPEVIECNPTPLLSTLSESRLSLASSIMVLSFVPRTCREGGHLIEVREASAILCCGIPCWFRYYIPPLRSMTIICGNETNQRYF